MRPVRYSINVTLDGCCSACSVHVALPVLASQRSSCERRTQMLIRFARLSASRVPRRENGCRIPSGLAPCIL